MQPTTWKLFSNYTKYRESNSLEVKKQYVPSVTETVSQLSGLRVFLKLLTWSFCCLSCPFRVILYRDRHGNSLCPGKSRSKLNIFLCNWTVTPIMKLMLNKKKQLISAVSWIALFPFRKCTDQESNTFNIVLLYRLGRYLLSEENLEHW